MTHCLESNAEPSAIASCCLPSGYEPVPHQVGGHFFTDGRLGLLRRCGDTKCVLKPKRRFPKGEREVQFYQMVFSSDTSSAVLSALQYWIPRYHGLVLLPIGKEASHQQFLLLEDQCDQLARASVLDVKIGRRVWDNEASQERISLHQAKYPLMTTLGFRISAMLVYNRTMNVQNRYEKKWGFSLSAEEVMNALGTYFSDGVSKRLGVIAEVLKQLKNLVEFFESQDLIHFYGSSLLIVYNFQQLDCTPCVRVKMIDFEKTYLLSSGERSQDENYLFGLNRFVSALQQL